MIKDQWLRLLFIPVLAVVISYVSGLFHYINESAVDVAVAFVYFLAVSWTIWRGCRWIHLRIRTLYAVGQGVFSKLALVSFSSSLYTASVSGIAGIAWLRLSSQQFSWLQLNRFILLSVFAVIVFTLVYEILFLTKERELDNHIVSQLDNELTRVEIIALRNELDPHFIYNSLNTLSQFISTDAEKASAYNQKLAKLYRYFLENATKELVPASQELAFIREYFSLLQMVYENRMFLSVELTPRRMEGLLLMPCSLQLLVENAIKHNQFTTEHPLRICISIEGEHIVVRNTLNRRRSLPTTRIGLKNLKTQYQLLARKTVVVDYNDDQFLVRLPIITDNEASASLKFSLAG